MKCSKCKQQIPKGEEAYFEAKVICQRCWHLMKWRRKTVREYLSWLKV